MEWDNLQEDKGDKRRLLRHPLLEAFLHAKWMSIRKYYVGNLFLYLFCLCVFTFLIQSKLQPNKNSKDFFDQNGTFVFGYIVTVCNFVYLFFREISQLLTMERRKEYIRLENAMDWAVIITTFIYLITIWFDTRLALNTGLWAMLLGWMNLTFYFGAFPLFGTVIYAIANITLTLISVIWIVLPIVAGFMLFFNFTFATEDGALQDFKKTFLKTVAMMLGNIDIEEFYSESTGLNSTGLNSTSKFDLKIGLGSNEVGIFCFMIFICIVIVNVMIGLTVNRINEILDNAHLIRQDKINNAYQGFLSFFKFNAHLIRQEKINNAYKGFLSFFKLYWEPFSNTIIEVSCQPIKSKFAPIYSLFLRAQGVLDTGTKHFEYNATVYSKETPKIQIAIPMLLFQEAEKICEKREELAKKNQDVADNKNFRLKTQDAQEKLEKANEKHQGHNISFK